MGQHIDACKLCIAVFPVATVVSSSDGNRSDNNDGSVSVAVFIGTVVGTLLLNIFIIIMIVMILYWRNRKSRRADDKDAQSSSTNYPQQHAHNNPGQSDQCDSTGSNVLSK